MTRPVRYLDQFRERVSNASDGFVALNGFYKAAATQYERHEDDKENLTPAIKLRRPNIYELERELEHDCLARTKRHEIRQELAEYIEKNCPSYQMFIYQKWLDRLSVARTSGAVGVNPDGRHITAWDDKVNCVRLCPDEAREECQRLTRKYAPEILRLLKANPRWRCYYAVYTDPNAPQGELKTAKKDQYKKFSNMHRSKWGKSCLKGSFVIQEDPLSKHLDWNVHLNAIHIVEGKFDYKEVRRQWGSNVEIKQIKGSPEEICRAFMEAVKYAAKHVGEKSLDGKHTVAPGMTSWPWQAFDEWFASGRGFRRSRAYGLLYNIEAEPEKSDIDMDNVVWIGTMKYNMNAYEVHLKKSASALFGVDLILADKFANSRTSPTKQARHGAMHHPPNRT